MAQPAQVAHIPASVRQLRTGSAEEKKSAAFFLWSLIIRAGPHAADDVAAPMAAAGAIPPLVRIVSNSRSGDLLLQAAAAVLGGIACGSPQRADAVVAAGGVGPLVRLIGSPAEGLQWVCAQALAIVSDQCSGDGAASAAEAAGAILTAVRHLSSSKSETVIFSAQLLRNLAAGSPSRQRAIHSAGGIAALVRCVRRGSRPGAEQADWLTPAQVALFTLANGSAERCKAVAEAGGAAACVAVVSTAAGTEESKFHAAGVLSGLALHGQAAAVVAADPSQAVEAALQGLLSRSPAPDDRRDAAAALLALASARQAAAPPQAAPTPPRVCAAPGCGATEGRLKRCSACGTVRCCSEACQAAHWPAHRRECRRVCAERAAAEAAAGSSGAAGPSQH